MATSSPASTWWRCYTSTWEWVLSVKTTQVIKTNTQTNYFTFPCLSGVQHWWVTRRSWSKAKVLLTSGHRRESLPLSSPTTIVTLLSNASEWSHCLQWKDSQRRHNRKLTSPVYSSPWHPINHGGHQPHRYACAPFLENANEGTVLVPAFVWVHHCCEHYKCMAHLQEGLWPSRCLSVAATLKWANKIPATVGWSPSSEHKPQVCRPNPRVLHPTQKVCYAGIRHWPTFGIQQGRCSLWSVDVGTSPSQCYKFGDGKLVICLNNKKQCFVEYHQKSVYVFFFFSFCSFMWMF